MSTLVYDEHQHSVQILDAHGDSLGSWSAYNNSDSGFATAHYGGQRHLNARIYSVIDRSRPLPHLPSPNGPYGSYGIIRFNYPGHSGVGLHAGRANSAHAPGAQHATHGCIRTTDEAMQAITGIMATDAITTIQVR